MSTTAGWFEASVVAEGLVLIREPHVHPLLRANTWLVRGRDRDLLVDSGLGILPIRPVVLALTAGREPTVVLTHDHLDHMGGAHEFTDVGAHPAESPERPRGSLHGPTLASMLGVRDELPESLLGSDAERWVDSDGYRLLPVRPSTALEDGDSIDLGDRVLQVLHLPGHSPGSIALLEPDTGTLFSGDVVYDDEPLDDLVRSDRPSYVASMRRLLDLDVRVVHAGHDDDLTGDRMREIAEHYVRTQG
ncbi:MAG: MBL fold metallo-hydrolase [Nocardioidaceae bacterium]|nr:MBL fold metallo-hydrolase [Nocardioidaceae bacterium]